METINLTGLADSLEKTVRPARELTIIQSMGGKLYHSEVMGSGVYLWGGDQLVIGKLAVISAGDDEYGRLVFASPSATVLAVIEGWGHNIEGSTLVAKGVGAGE